MWHNPRALWRLCCRDSCRKRRAVPRSRPPRSKSPEGTHRTRSAPRVLDTCQHHSASKWRQIRWRRCLDCSSPAQCFRLGSAIQRGRARIRRLSSGWRGSNSDRLGTATARQSPLDSTSRRHIRDNQSHRCHSGSFGSDNRRTALCHPSSKCPLGRVLRLASQQCSSDRMGTWCNLRR